MPSGRILLISSIFFSVAVITSEELDPKSFTTIPATTSVIPSLVCKPRRMAPPILILASCLKKTGVPCSDLITMFSRSSMLVASPTERTMYSSEFFSMNCAPTFKLLPFIISITSLRVTSYLSRASGCTSIWNCFSQPPMPKTSVTPGTVCK